MQCGISSFFSTIVAVILGLYGAILILGVLQIVQGQKYRSDVIRAKDKELGVKRGWMTEYLDDNERIKATIWAGTILFQRVFTKNIALIITVFALIVSIAVQWDVCF
jgi:hypothetical protein